MGKLLGFNFFWRFLLVTLLMEICSSCGFLNHAERMYLNQIYGINEIRMPSSKSDSAWQRAKWFIRNYSSLRLLTSNDSVIATERPTIGGSGFGYKVTRHRVTDSLLFLSAFSFPPMADPLAPEKSSRDSFILTDYMKTGVIPFPQLIYK